MRDEFLQPADEFIGSNEFFEDESDEGLDPGEAPIVIAEGGDPERAFTDAMREYKARLDEAEARLHHKIDVLMDSRFFICVCFESFEQAEEWVQKAGLEDALDDEDPQYMDGVMLAERMAIELTPIEVEIEEKKPGKVYLDVSDPLPRRK